MRNKFRAFEDYGIFISIPFARNLDREPSWRYIIENVEDELAKSTRFGSFELCEIAALKHAVEFID